MSGAMPPAEIGCLEAQMYTLYHRATYGGVGVIGVSLTGLLLEANSGQGTFSGWWQAFAACAVQCVAGSAVFVIAAKGHRLFGSDIDN